MKGKSCMQNYILSCCSTADLTKEHLNKRQIEYICFHFEIDEKEYPDDLGKSMPPEQLYEKMLNGSTTRTSQVNSTEFIEYFEPFLKEGKDILHVCLSSGISGVINSANIAKETLEEKYPDRKIYVVDSLSASSGYGLLMDTRADLRDAGMSVKELYDWAVKHALNVQHWFFSTDLTFYVRGGRISKTAGFIGSALNICPLLYVDNAGKLIPRQKIRSKKKVIEAIVDKMVEHAENGTDYSGKVFISNSACYEDAKKVSDLIVQRFPKLQEPPVIFNIGATIGSHTGPGTVALFFFGNKR